jgi:hypothetical protein
MKNKMKKIIVACMMIGLSSTFTTHGMLLQKRYQHPAFQQRFRTRRSTNAEILKELRTTQMLLRKIRKQQNFEQRYNLITSKEACPTRELFTHNFRDKHHGSYYSGHEKNHHADTEVDFGGYQFSDK